MDLPLFLAWIRTNLAFSFARSSGAGGQNVNKVNTKVTASLPVGQTGEAGVAGLTAAETERLLARLGSRLTNEGELQITVQETRHQARNRAIAERRIVELLIAASRPSRGRVATRPSTASRERRLSVKRRQSEKKSGRRFRSWEE